ncbi:hypothetical protein MNV49_000457 [Pseudohyphozyma bogoriensis]|nr:hypothetical protein MNV49_000457 [Pseudohyphozyma bogoriensis]
MSLLSGYGSDSYSFRPPRTAKSHSSSSGTPSSSTDDEQHTTRSLTSPITTDSTPAQQKATTSPPPPFSISAATAAAMSALQLESTPATTPVPLRSLLTLLVSVKEMEPNGDYVSFAVDEGEMGGREAVEKALTSADENEDVRVEWEGWGKLVVRRGGPGIIHDGCSGDFFFDINCEIKRLGLNKEIRSFGGSVCKSKDSGLKRYPDESWGPKENYFKEIPEPTVTVEVADSQTEKAVRKKMEGYLKDRGLKVVLVVLFILKTERRSGTFQLKVELWTRTADHEPVQYPYPHSTLFIDTLIAPLKSFTTPSAALRLPLAAFQGHPFPINISEEQGPVVEWKSEELKDLLESVEQLVQIKANAKKKRREEEQAEKGKGKRRKASGGGDGGGVAEDQSDSDEEAEIEGADDGYEASEE